MSDDNELRGFPRLQWSKFVNGGRDEQYVVRASTLDDLKAGIDQVRELIGGLPVAEQNAIEDSLKEAGAVCQVCGSPAEFKQGVSQKSGKPWKGYFCSTKQEGHVKWVK